MSFLSGIVCISAFLADFASFAHAGLAPGPRFSFAASALAFAFAFTARVLPITELAKKQIQTARHLRHAFGIAQTPTGVGFNELVSRFTIMLGPDNMRTAKRWWARARIWRFVLLQDRAGFFDPSADLSVALMAHKIRPENIVRERRGFGPFRKEVAQFWEENPEPEPLSGDSADEEEAAGKRQLPGGGGGALQAVKPVDATCPLSGFDADAVQWSLPAVLVELEGKHRRRGFNASRVWATVLSVVTLMRFDESWLVSGEHDADETIVDRAMGWIDLQAEKFPELSPVLPTLLEEATRMVADSWELVHEIAIKGARDEQLRLKELHNVSQMTRAAGHMATMSLVKHETMACFTAPPTDGVLRYQRVMVYLTAVLAMLCVEVRTMISGFRSPPLVFSTASAFHSRARESAAMRERGAS